jgi:hypothetical protein
VGTKSEPILGGIFTRYCNRILVKLKLRELDSI